MDGNQPTEHVVVGSISERIVIQTFGPVSLHSVEMTIDQAVYFRDALTAHIEGIRRGHEQCATLSEFIGTFTGERA